MPSGAFRTVLLIGNFAIKLPRLRNFLQGLRCNRWEREMWNYWQPIFQWKTLCPVYVSDPLGLFVVMPRAIQPVSEEEVDTLPDYYPPISAELKPDDYGCLKGNAVALDYGLWDKDMVDEKRNYYANHAHKPAIEIPKND